jgi:hypothetical protein
MVLCEAGWARELVSVLQAAASAAWQIASQ